MKLIMVPAIPPVRSRMIPKASPFDRPAARIARAITLKTT